MITNKEIWFWITLLIGLILCTGIIIGAEDLHCALTHL